MQKQSPEAFPKTKVFLKILQTSREYICIWTFLNKVAGHQPASFLKRLQHNSFPVKFAKLLRIPISEAISENICKQLLLELF